MEKKKEDIWFSQKASTILFISVLISSLFSSCTAQKQLSTRLEKQLLENSALVNAHTGIAIYDVDAKKFLLRHNSDKYFVPASNIKLVSLYAGMKYLGDSLTGIQYAERNDTIFLLPSGDPTFLHAGYKTQPVFDFLKKQDKKIVISNEAWKTEIFGSGWSWDDYLGESMVERNALPVYGNMIKWSQEKIIEQKENSNDTSMLLTTDPEVNWDVKFDTLRSKQFQVTRPITENVYKVTEGAEMKKELEIPFVTNGIESAIQLLQDNLNKKIIVQNFNQSSLHFQSVHSQPVDSMFQPMMHRSDNFFAEQTLLMVSNQLLGYMNEQKLIDTLLKTDLNGLPQKPVWVDGSGLSRYNLFSPEDFVWLLNKMKDEFGIERIKNILPTGNTGTLRNYYADEAGFIFAKTGTLSGQIALSGFLITAKNKLLIFSVLVNNHNSSGTAVRRAVEQFLKDVRKMN